MAAKRFVKSNCQNIKLYNQWVKHHVGILRWAAEMSRCVTGTRTIVRFLIIHQMSHCSLRYIDWMTGWLESPTYIYSSLRSEIILNSVVLPAACVSLPGPPLLSLSVCRSVSVSVCTHQLSILFQVSFHWLVNSRVHFEPAHLPVFSPLFIPSPDGLTYIPHFTVSL